MGNCYNLTMVKSNDNPAKGITWDLSDLYSGFEDPKIEKNKNEIKDLAEKFVKKYKGKINSPDLTTEFLLQCLQDYEQILEKQTLFSNYFYYRHSKDTQSEKVSKYYQQAREFSNQISSQLVWLELEWVNLDNQLAKKLINHPKLADYSHYLAHERKFKSHRLSEKEEQILVKKSQTSGSAFVKLYDLIDNGLKLKLKIDGQIKELSQSELKPYLTVHPNREIRKSAAEALTKGVKSQQKLYAFILNTLLLDKKINDELRNYKYPQQATFLSYEVDKKTVDNLVETVEKSYSICEHFYLTKQEILKVDQLYEWDRYSPIYKTDKTYSWKEAKTIILDAFYQFSDQFGNIAKLFFDKKWIDAEISEGKHSGAFCSYGTPSTHSYVLINFTGKINDILTLAHELGHGIHHYLSRDQKLLEFWASTAVAEIASIFCESLVFDKLFQELGDKKIKTNLLANKLQSDFSSIFRQIAFYQFETAIHRHRREKGELSLKEFSQYYQHQLQAMFGKGLKLTRGHQYWWMPILHFYHYNFYVFTYSMGNLLTYSLYNIYQNDKKSFLKNYLKALKLGGSKTPAEIIAVIGIDISDREFWQHGIDYLNNLVNQFENLTK